MGSYSVRRKPGPPAVVVVSATGSLLGFGAGVSPHWIVDAAGAELWAFKVVASLNVCLPLVITDCKGIYDTLQTSPPEACGHKRALGRTWSMVAQHLDQDFAEAAKMVRWMPSHTSLSAIGTARDSHGQLVTTLMWRANRLADALAKKAASQHRLPVWVSKLVGDAAVCTRHQLALLGVVTFEAHNHRVSQITEGGATKEFVYRDSTAQRPYFKKRGMTVTDAVTTESPPPAASTAPPPGQLGQPRPLQAKRPCLRSQPQSTAGRARGLKRKAVETAETLRQQADDETRVASWLSSRRLQPAGTMPAVERMHALRTRLRDKFQSSGQPSCTGV